MNIYVLQIYIYRGNVCLIFYFQSKNFLLLIFLEVKSAFLYFPFIFHLVRFGLLFHTVKLFQVPTYLPSHPAAESSRHHELLTQQAQWPYQRKVRSVRGVPVPFTLTEMITYLFPFCGLMMTIYCKVLSVSISNYAFCDIRSLNLFPFLKTRTFPILTQSQVHLLCPTIPSSLTAIFN